MLHHLLFALAASTLLAESAPLQLGGKAVPPEKFNLFIVHGDSNTFGANGRINTTPADASWSSPRAWSLNPEGQWTPVIPAILQARPAQGGGDQDRGQFGVAYWLARTLTEIYPDDHFGVVEFCRAGGFGEGAAPAFSLENYDAFMDLLLPYKGQATLRAIVLDGRVATGRDNPARDIAELRTRIQEDWGIRNLPLVISGWRKDNYAVWGDSLYDIRATPALYPEATERSFVGRPAVRTALALANDKSVPNLALFFGMQLHMDDNRHAAGRGLHGRFGLDHYGGTFARILAARGWATASPNRDTVPPSTPAKLRVTATHHEGLTLAWDPSTDNFGVHGYRVYQDKQLLGYVPGLDVTPPALSSLHPTYSPLGLTPGTSASFTVVAVDYAGIESKPTTPLRATTAVRPTPPPSPLLINVGGPAVGPWQADKEYREGGVYGTFLSPGSVVTDDSPPSGLRSPYKEVFSSYRKGPCAYEAFLPNGKYRVTWLFRLQPHHVTALENSGEFLGGPLGPGNKIHAFPSGHPLANITSPGSRTNVRAISSEVTVTNNRFREWPAGRKLGNQQGSNVHALMIEKL